MTASEYYKKTSEMSYQVPVAETIDDGGNVIVGKIGLANRSREDAERILAENDFFAVDCNTDDIDLEEVSLVLEFHYGIDRWDAYLLNVCDVIDCRDAGGRLVLSCSGKPELISEVFPEAVEKAEDKEPKAVEKAEDKEPEDNEGDAEEPEDNEGDAEEPKAKPCKCERCRRCTIFDEMDDLFSVFSHPFFGSRRLPAADDDKAAETEEATEDSPDEKDGNDDLKSSYINLSCKVDPDGNVNIRKTTNGETVERNYKLSELGDRLVDELKRLL